MDAAIQCTSPPWLQPSVLRVIPFGGWKAPDALREGTNSSQNVCAPVNSRCCRWHMSISPASFFRGMGGLAPSKATFGQAKRSGDGAKFLFLPVWHHHHGCSQTSPGLCVPLNIISIIIIIIIKKADLNGGDQLFKPSKWETFVFLAPFSCQL